VIFDEYKITQVPDFAIEFFLRITENLSSRETMKNVMVRENSTAEGDYGIHRERYPIQIQKGHDK
jgi:hypothetical protein